MNDLEIINILRENCDDENALVFLSNIFSFELEKKGKWKPTYEKFINDYFESNGGNTSED